MNVVACDIGAGSGRVILGRFDGSRLAMRELHRFDNRTVTRNSHLHWDVERLYTELQSGLTIAGTECKPASVGIDTWGVDGAFLDRDGRLLDLPFGYRDFSVEEMREAIAVTGADRLYDITGIQFLPFNTLFQFYRHARESYQPYTAASRFLFMPDYLRYRLTGTQLTEYTIASTSQLLEVTTGKWSPELLERYLIRPELLGAICRPGTPAGTVRETGIPAIAVAGHDTASAVAVVPADDSRGSWAWLSSGTWSIMGVEVKRPVITADARRHNFSNEGGVNGTVRFLKNIMGLWILQECRRLWAETGQEFSYETLHKLAWEADGMMPRIPVNDNRFLAPENMLQEITSVCRETGQPVPATPGEFTRCILESLASEYARTVHDMERITGTGYDVLHIVGGGSRNRLLNQLTADACGIPVIAGPDEATALGNIVMQLIAAGELKNIPEARRVVRESYDLQWYYPDVC